MINFGIRFRSLAETSNFLNISDAFRDHFISLYGPKKLKPKLLWGKEITSEKYIQAIRWQMDCQKKKKLYQ